MLLLTGFGFLSAAAFAATMQDKIYKYLSARYNDSGRPEYRLVVTQVCFFTLPLCQSLLKYVCSYRAVRYDNLPDRTSNLVLDSRKTNDLDRSNNRICYIRFRFDVGFQ